jgi:hypothetical protein
VRGLLAVLIAALAFAVPVGATTGDTRLDDAASWIAQRSVSVLCYAADEPGAPSQHGAWGYVWKPLGTATEVNLDGRLCRAILDVNSPGNLRALGVLVLTHESYHLRRWGAAGDEGKVECKAIRHWKYTARRLGATEETIAFLWPAALKQHNRLARYRDWFTGEREYFEPSCRVPK